MRRSIGVLLLASFLSLLLAGCLASEEPSDVQIPADPGRPGADDVEVGRPAVDAKAVEGDPYGEPERSESGVETGLDAGGWKATRTLSFANGVGEAASAEVSFGIGAGAIDVRATDNGSYGLHLVLEARAATEEEARSAVASMEADFADSLQDGVLGVRLHVESDATGLVDGLLPGLFDVRTSATLTADLPARLAYALDMDSGSGDVAAEALAGTRLHGDAGSGSVRFAHVNFDQITADTGSGDVRMEDVRAGTIEADTGSGRIVVHQAVADALEADSGSGDHDVQGAFDRVTAASGSGRQSYALTARASGPWHFEAGSGDVTVDLERATGQAFDVMAENGSGSIRVDLEDGEPVGPQDEDRAHVRSQGYSGAAIQTAITAATGSGDITVTE